MRDFQLDHQAYGTVELVQFSGSLDMDSFPRLETQLNAFFQQGRYAILIDCSDLDYIGSAGMGALIGFAKLAREKGGDLKLINVPESTLKTIKSLGFTKVLQVHNDKGTALASFHAD